MLEHTIPHYITNTKPENVPTHFGGLTQFIVLFYRDGRSPAISRILCILLPLYIFTYS